MTNILCLGSESDGQLQHLASALRDAGACPLIVNTAHYPATFSVVCEPNSDSFALVIDNEVYEVDQFDSFFWQRYYPPISQHPHDSKNALSALSPLFYYRPEHWFNSLSAVRFHQAKPVQLQEAQKLGANIPATLISNDQRRLQHFSQRYDKVIIKPVFGGAHTQLIGQDNALMARDEWQHHQPVTLQKYIEGDEVRTFVIGHRVFAAAIYSDQPDYRVDSHTQAEAITLPKDIEALSVAICLQFGMKWCAIDWRREADGKYVFLEANPAPMFCKFEAETGLPVTEALVHALTNATG